MYDIENLIVKLREEKNLSDDEFAALIQSREFDELLYKTADEVRREHYGDEVYIRGLIEFSNYCRNDCFYCGIRCSNKNVVRYRLDKGEILECCRDGYRLGFRTFVLQGGEDLYYTDEKMCDIIASMRGEFSDCAITLSLGEKSKASYQAYFDAGANRYLLRHETADVEHYKMLHPNSLSIKERQRCLFDLKEIGYQVGSGFMVGSPWQTTGMLVEDLRFLQKLMPDMIGIGPFIPHRETPFAKQPRGGLELTLKMLSILRLMFPYALLPSTTALGTIDKNGREKGLAAGANVVMPNLSPKRVRKLYELYENKIHTDEEAAESVDRLKKTVAAAGYRVVTAVGNVKR